ncbi:DeoR/GlpR family DNA-binding transcription regulator [Leifsonia bigeumensis]|uniref:Lactose phosphotransferase system repressor n=1 Tax=Leifsonella bigeumensis TaxID=433643 RepID=A0ABP7FWP2_9MICO
MNARDQRHQIVLNILHERGRVEVTELRETLGVTEMTIRRDLEILEADGALKRVHGGATLPIGSGFEPPFSARRKIHVEAKESIARLVSDAISDGDTILLDGGSTGLAVAHALFSRVLTICPLSLRAATFLATSPTINLRVPGGAVRQGEQSFIGADVTDYLDAHNFDHYVMTASGVSVRGGITEWNPEDAAVKRKALQSSANIIAAADASKFGRTGFVRICSIETPNVIFTDKTLSDTDLETVSEHGARVIRAQ